ncbi:DUF4253 domain-containing protein [Streptomyces sp. bgisy159]|uniref:DUF4253 domain-containing protein n=1 Tax=Streptomyces sp. bgisy159 TaxID=3413795 RepID=UPI003F49EDF8
MATLPNPLPRLATDPSGRSLGLQLPPGRLIQETDDGPWHEPLLWHAEKAAASGVWKALGVPAARAGLLPVLVDVSAQGGPTGWELMPGDVSYPGDHDAEEVLAEYWGDQNDGDDGNGNGNGNGETVEGTPWPGLAPAGVLTADPDVRAAGVADALAENGPGWFKDPSLALVPARRSADVPAAIGWSGPLNHENDVARLCAVLRSWEDRFGIRVVALGFDVLVVSVAAPPTDRATAEALAVEHSAFCPDNITTTLAAYAEELVGADSWTFWWD